YSSASPFNRVVGRSRRKVVICEANQTDLPFKSRLRGNRPWRCQVQSVTPDTPVSSMTSARDSNRSPPSSSGERERRGRAFLVEKVICRPNRLAGQEAEPY